MSKCTKHFQFLKFGINGFSIFFNFRSLSLILVGLFEKKKKFKKKNRNLIANYDFYEVIDIYHRKCIMYNWFINKMMAFNKCQTYTNNLHFIGWKMFHISNIAHYNQSQEN